MATPTSSIPDLGSTIETGKNAVGAFTHYYSSNLPWIQALSITLTVAFVGTTIYFIVITGWLSFHVNNMEKMLTKKNLSKKRVIKAWKRVKRHEFAGDENSLKLALIEADKILDEALRLLGYTGKSLGERLQQLNESQLSNLNQVWEAHKIRNRIVHESSFNLPRATAERALTVYEEAFKELSLLDE